jgi:hypothetical protein
MSSIKAEKIYRLANRLSRLALFLDEDNKSVIGQTLGVTEREEWIEESLVKGGMFIKSKVNGLRLGFSGPPAEGVKIIVGESAIAKVWDIEPDANPSDYEIRLRGTHWVIEFDRDNVHPGMHARLAKEKFPKDTSQVWVVIEAPMN